jgi:hypothetical protein
MKSKREDPGEDPEAYGGQEEDTQDQFRYGTHEVQEKPGAHVNEGVWSRIAGGQKSDDEGKRHAERRSRNTHGQGVQKRFAPAGKTAEIGRQPFTDNDWENTGRAFDVTLRIEEVRLPKAAKNHKKNHCEMNGSSYERTFAL